MQKMKGTYGIGCISDYESQPLIIRSIHGTYALTTVSKNVSLANTIGADDKLDGNNNLDCSMSLDYEMVDQLIEGERNKSINFLKKALED